MFKKALLLTGAVAMILAGMMFIVGVAFSAIFSGSETGFYRATRVRLTMDALSGDRAARPVGVQSQISFHRRPPLLSAAWVGLNQRSPDCV